MMNLNFGGQAPATTAVTQEPFRFAAAAAKVSHQL
jgi:hypothetical protein